MIIMLKVFSLGTTSERLGIEIDPYPKSFNLPNHLVTEMNYLEDRLKALKGVQKWLINLKGQRSLFDEIVYLRENKHYSWTKLKGFLTMKVPNLQMGLGYLKGGIKKAIRFQLSHSEIFRSSTE